MSYKKWIVCFALLLFSRCLLAVELKTALIRIVINDKGFYTSIKVNDREIIGLDAYRMIAAVKDGQILKQDLWK